MKLLGKAQVGLHEPRCALALSDAVAHDISGRRILVEIHPVTLTFHEHAARLTVHGRQTGALRSSLTKLLYETEIRFLTEPLQVVVAVSRKHIWTIRGQRSSHWLSMSIEQHLWQVKGAVVVGFVTTSATIEEVSIAQSRIVSVQPAVGIGSLAAPVAAPAFDETEFNSVVIALGFG